MRNKVIWQEIHDEAPFELEEVFYYAYYAGEELGYIEFHSPWKKWVWNQNEDIIMDFSCLQEVCNKLGELKNGSR